MTSRCNRVFILLAQGLLVSPVATWSAYETEPTLEPDFIKISPNLVLLALVFVALILFVGEFWSYYQTKVKHRAFLDRLAAIDREENRVLTTVIKSVEYFGNELFMRLYVLDEMQRAVVRAKVERERLTAYEKARKKKKALCQSRTVPNIPKTDDARQDGEDGGKNVISKPITSLCVEYKCETDIGDTVVEEKVENNSEIESLLQSLKHVDFSKCIETKVTKEANFVKLNFRLPVQLKNSNEKVIDETSKCDVSSETELNLKTNLKRGILKKSGSIPDSRAEEKIAKKVKFNLTADEILAHSMETSGQYPQTKKLRRVKSMISLHDGHKLC